MEVDVCLPDSPVVEEMVHVVYDCTAALRRSHSFINQVIDLFLHALTADAKETTLPWSFKEDWASLNRVRGEVNLGWGKTVQKMSHIETHPGVVCFRKPTSSLTRLIL